MDDPFSRITPTKSKPFVDSTLEQIARELKRTRRDCDEIDEEIQRADKACKQIEPTLKIEQNYAPKDDNYKTNTSKQNP